MYTLVDTLTHQIVINPLKIKILVRVHPDLSHSDGVFANWILLGLDGRGWVSLTEYVPNVRAGNHFQVSPTHPDLSNTNSTQNVNPII